MTKIKHIVSPRGRRSSPDIKWCGKYFGPYEKRFGNFESAIADGDYHPCKRCLAAKREYLMQSNTAESCADDVCRAMRFAERNEMGAVDELSHRVFDNLTYIQKLTMVRLVTKLKPTI
jgi:hypothetical protein